MSSAQLLADSDYDYSDDDYDGASDENEELEAGSIASNDVEDELLKDTQDEIADDFERLVNNLQTPTTAGGAPTWSISIDEDSDFNLEDDILDPVRASRKKKGRGRRTRTGIELSHQVKAMIGEAAAAYIDKDSQKAIDICREVIRIEPAAHEAWNTLALVHEELNEHDTALKLRIMAAHLQGDADVWRELGRASRQMDQMQQSLYCFRKAVSLDPKDVDAIWDRSVVLRETGEIRAALSGFLSILKVAPHHIGVLIQTGPLFSALSEFHRGIALYKDALAFYQETIPTGPANGEEADFTLLLITLADFCNSVGEYEQTINMIRDGARWTQGRASQRYWSSVTDDREYDVYGSVRLHEPNESAGRTQGFFPLDPNLRHRLALARLALGDLEEAQMHGSIVLQNDVREYCLLFTELAAAYFSKELYQASLEVYETLSFFEDTSTINTLMQISACNRYLGDFDKAIEVMKYVLEVEPDNIDAKMKLAELYEIIDEPRLALSLVNEVIAWRAAHSDQRPLATYDPGVADNGAASAMFAEKKSHTKTKSSLPIETVRALEQSRQAVVDGHWSKVVSLNPEGADLAAWLKEAGSLIDIFRETRELFGGNRFSQFRGSINERRLRRIAGKGNQDHEADVASRLQADITTKSQTGVLKEFRQHTFDEWLDLILRYAFIASRSGQYRIADEVLRHMLLSNGFATFSHQTSLRLGLLACATVQRDYPAIMEHSRRLIFTHQFNNDPLRLYLACMGGGIYTIDTFIDTNFQKLMHREIDIYRMVARGCPKQWVPARNRWSVKEATARPGDDSEEEEEAPKPSKGGRKEPTATSSPSFTNPTPSMATKESPILLTLYGQISANSKSWQSALFYLLEAYDIQPNDPVICLSLAVASASRAMQRQADNRHHLIAQALTFIQKYRTVRTERYTDEIEYNFGRLFHQLGLLALAVRHYTLALNYAESRLEKERHGARPSECDSVAKEAAYNLVLIYGTTGGHGLANAVARKWLSF